MREGAVQKNLLINRSSSISSLVGYFKKTIAFLVYAIRFHVTVHNNRCLHKSVRQTENGLERGFVLNTGQTQCELPALRVYSVLGCSKVG